MIGLPGCEGSRLENGCRFSFGSPANLEACTDRLCGASERACKGPMRLINNVEWNKEQLS